MRAMQFRDGLRDGQTKTVTGMGPAGFAPIQSPEQLFMLACRHARPVIGNGQCGPVIQHRQRQQDVRAWRRVKNGILDQVGQKLGKQRRITTNLDIVPDVHRQSVTAGFRHGSK